MAPTCQEKSDLKPTSRCCSHVSGLFVLPDQTNWLWRLALMRSAYRLPISKRDYESLVRNGIVRSAVTLRVWLSVIISLALLLPDLVLANKRAKLWDELHSLTVCAGRRDRQRVWRSLAQGAVAPSCGSCHGYPVTLTLGQNAHATRAILLARATAATRFGLRRINCLEPFARQEPA